MFNTSVTTTDIFIEMPQSTQFLYFHLGMHVDDDGFVGPRKVMRMIGSNQDDLNILIARKYLIPFPSGVLAMTHYRINNIIRKDWYKPTIYQEEKKQLAWDESGLYFLVNGSLTVRVNPSVNAVVPPTVNAQIHQPLPVNETSALTHEVSTPVTHSMPPEFTVPVHTPSSQLTNELINKEKNKELSLSEIEAEKEKIRRRMTEFD